MASPASTAEALDRSTHTAIKPFSTKQSSSTPGNRSSTTALSSPCPWSLEEYLSDLRAGLIHNPTASNLWAHSDMALSLTPIKHTPTHTHDKARPSITTAIEPSSDKHPKPALRRVQRIECLRVHCELQDCEELHKEWLTGMADVDPRELVWMRAAVPLEKMHFSYSKYRVRS